MFLVQVGVVCLLLNMFSDTDHEWERSIIVIIICFLLQHCHNKVVQVHSVYIIHVPLHKCRYFVSMH